MNCQYASCMTLLLEKYLFNCIFFQPNVFLHGLKHLFLTVATNELEGIHRIFLTASLTHLQFACGKNTAY